MSEKSDKIENKIMMISLVDCPFCDEAKKLLTKDNKIDKIQIIDESHEDFLDIIDEHNIEGFPTFITPNGKSCDLTGNDKEYYLDCDDDSQIKL